MEVRIRPQRITDAEYSWVLRKDKEVWKYAICESPWNPITLESEREFYAQQIELSRCIRFAILVDGEYVGNVFIDNVNNSAYCYGELHTHILDKRYWGKGIGYECNRLILEYAFRVTKLKGVYQYVNPDNTANWKNGLKLGFEKRGRKEDNPNVYLFTIKREKWIKELK